MFKPYYLSSLVTRFYAENSKKYYCKSDSGLFVYIQSNRFETVFTTDKMVCICKTCLTQCPFLQDLNICQIHDACFVSFWDNVLRRVCQKKTCKYIIRTYCHQSISRQGSWGPLIWHWHIPGIEIKTETNDRALPVAA